MNVISMDVTLQVDWSIHKVLHRETTVPQFLLDIIYSDLINSEAALQHLYHLTLFFE